MGVPLFPSPFQIPPTATQDHQGSLDKLTDASRFFVINPHHS
jgi:hypothetical protein